MGSTPSGADKARSRRRQSGQIHLKGLLLLAVLALGLGTAGSLRSAPGTPRAYLLGSSPAAAPAVPARPTLGMTKRMLQSRPPGPAAPPRAAVRAVAPGPRAIQVLAGADCLSGRTATGTEPGPGTVAVDPAVIPYGTHLYVTGYGYGYAVDTGGGLSGHMINVWENCAAARAWGLRTVTVYLLGG